MERVVILPLPPARSAPAQAPARQTGAASTPASAMPVHTPHDGAGGESFAALCRSVAGGDSHAAPTGRRWLRPDW